MEYYITGFTNQIQTSDMNKYTCLLCCCRILINAILHHRTGDVMCKYMCSYVSDLAVTMNFDIPSSPRARSQPTQHSIVKWARFVLLSRRRSYQVPWEENIC